ncbi:MULTISPECIES: DUF6266 family protein [Chryseobacterium]|uniref:DUF6266 family protein n=1 Tax=Chryseobacterium sp. R2A-55 TaxID=2744445 RepID=UPI001F2C1898|nr:DUF6266 family protein [Chryseobacterium sp. R2A-55]
MGEIKKGILGGFRGTVGTVVGSTYRGKSIIRSRPTASHKPPTEEQLLQRKKFRLVIKFLNPLQGIQSQLFGSRAGVKSRVNLAVSYTLREAVKVVNGEPELLFNKVLITKGELSGFKNPQVTLQAGGVVTCSWEDNSGQATAAEDDVFGSAIYCPELNEFVLTDGIAMRAELTAEQVVPDSFTGKQVQVYLWFRNAAGKIACTSLYMGEMMIL